MFTSGKDRFPGGQLIASEAKRLIPLPHECPDKITVLVRRKLWIGARDFGPGMYPGLSVWLRFKRNPLFHCVAQRMINPRHLFGGRANCNHMINRRLDGLHYLDFHPAARGPWLAFGPADASINVGKAGPKAIIAK